MESTNRVAAWPGTSQISSNTSSTRVPDRVALIVGDRATRRTRELEERANRLAHHLAAQGIGPGDHVGIYGFNSHEFVETILAAYKLRAVPINVNYRYVEAELRYLFDNADLVALVHDAQYTPRIAAVRESLPMLRHLIAIDDGSGTDTSAIGSVAVRRGARGGSRPSATSSRAPTTTSTSSTPAVPPGMPKGVVWRQEDVLCVLGGLRQLRHRRSASPTSGEFAERRGGRARRRRARGIVIAPLMHGAAQWGTLNGLINGRTTVLMPKFDAARRVEGGREAQDHDARHHRRRDGPPADRGARRGRSTTRRRS